MLSGLAKLAINKVFEMLFGGGVGGVAGGNSGGGWLSKLIGIGINFIGGLFGGGGGSSHEVGHFGRFAEGGLVIGGIPNKDSVPIMAMPGEFVAKTDAVNYYGPDYFAALNAKKIKKFSEGGLVGNSFNFNQSSVKNYAGNQNFSHLQKQASASNGQNVTIHLSQNFQANPKTGAFSKESADQAARAAARALNNAMRRS